jgi:hypothetical protein
MVAPDTPPGDAARFIVGTRTGFFNGSWPMAEAFVVDEGIRVGLRSSFLRRVFPTTSRAIPFGDLSSASQVGSSVPGNGGFGLSIRPAIGPWVVLYGPRRTVEALVAALEQGGVSVRVPLKGDGRMLA